MGLQKLREKIFNWELWPFWLRYAGLMPFWVGYCIRARSPWFFTASNPTITFGGFDGEGKKEMYLQLPEGTYPKTSFVAPGLTQEALKEKIAAHHFSYPFCVKPDIGLKGLLFRKIDNEKSLLYYHEKMDMEYMVQDLILYPLEVSVFYCRYPNERKGIITGFLQKELMEVVGDGASTLWQLIQAHPNASHRLEEMRIKHADNLGIVLPRGQQYFLTYAANLNRGAKFVNLNHLIDEDLHKVFDALSHHTSFYYGRYDIKCRSVAELKKGAGFLILEFNGAGAEPNHVYQSGLSLLQAYKVILRHWKYLFEIAQYNHRNGIKYWPFWKGYRFLKAASKHGQRLEQLDAQILL